MLLMSRDKAAWYGIEPLASIVSMGWAGVGPTMMGERPVPASRRALAHAGLEPGDIDFWEINEAFAIVALNAIKELGISSEKVSVKGGALALGHSLGATGTRLVGTVALILSLEGGTYGPATRASAAVRASRPQSRTRGRRRRAGRRAPLRTACGCHAGVLVANEVTEGGLVLGDHLQV